MKKLMIAVAIVCAAVMSQAAQMKWASATLKVPGTDTNVAGGYGSAAAFYLLDSTTYGSLTTAMSGMSAQEKSAYLYKEYGSKTATKTGAFTTGKSTLTDDTTYGANDTAYGLVIYTTYDNKNKTGDLYYIANMGEWHFDSDTTKTISNMGNTFGGDGGSGAISWQTAAVPEPTSSLLLLLGVAGLALRRRRA